MSLRDFQPVGALDVPPRARASNYPEPFASRMAGRLKRQLGDFFGITRFGVNLTTLRPGGQSASDGMYLTPGGELRGKW